MRVNVSEREEQTRSNRNLDPLNDTDAAIDRTCEHR